MPSDNALKMQGDFNNKLKTQGDFNGDSSNKSDENKSKGQVFICPIASSLSRLKGLDEFRGDFLELDSNLNKGKILAFYKQDFFSVCDYCRDMWEAGESIIPAIQTKEVLKIKRA